MNATDYVAHLGRSLREAEVPFLEHTAMPRLIAEGGRGAGRETAEGSIGADEVVVAAGVWSRRLLQTANLDVPLKPYRTPICVVEGLPSADLPVLHDLALDFSWVPETGGRLLLGAGTEEWEYNLDDYNRCNDESFILSVAERFSNRLVNVDRVNIARGWADLCGATPDRRPLLGPYGGVEGLHLAIGFNGFGVMRAPEVGATVA